MDGQAGGCAHLSRMPPAYQPTPHTILHTIPPLISDSSAGQVRRYHTYHFAYLSLLRTLHGVTGDGFW